MEIYASKANIIVTLHIVIESKLQNYTLTIKKIQSVNNIL